MGKALSNRIFTNVYRVVRENTSVVPRGGRGRGERMSAKLVGVSQRGATKRKRKKEGTLVKKKKGEVLYVV